MPQQGRDMKLKILACRLAYQGNSHGREFTIYEVSASKTDGTVINEKLRSFSSLPIGQEIEVTVTPYNSEQYGKSFTLHQKSGGARGQQLNEVMEQVERQREMIAALSKRVTTLEADLHRIVGGELMKKVDEGVERGLNESFPAPQPAPTNELTSSTTAPLEGSAALDAQFGADPPY